MAAAWVLRLPTSTGIRWSGFAKIAEGLFAEYLRYRELMAAAVVKRADNQRPADEVNGILDLIHMRYLIKHTPDSALEFIADQEMAGIDFAAYWPNHEIPCAALRDGGS